MKCINLFVLIFGIYIPSICCRHVQFYRKDYTYVEEFDAFYKVHTELSAFSWNAAFLTCDDEGATLFYPKAEDEWTVVKNLTNNNYMSYVSDIDLIFVGLHDEYRLGELITVDGYSIPYSLILEDLPEVTDNCVMMDIKTGFLFRGTCQRTPDTPLPFACKKVDDEYCPTIDRGYKFEPFSRKCYKINNQTKTWQDAMRTCIMEGGILAVIENSAESSRLKDMVEEETTYFVGVRRISSYGGGGELYTVKGQTFSKLYQNRGLDADSYDCGSVYKNVNNNELYTSTTPCSNKLPFICEMEIRKS